MRKFFECLGEKTDGLRGNKKFWFAFLLALSITSMFLVMSGGLNGNDFWWHEKTGEWILENGKVPTEDIYSWYGIENEFSWTAHEWLSEVIYALIYSAFGSTGIWAMAILYGAGFITVVFFTCKKHIEKSIPASAVFSLLFGLTVGMNFVPRPQTFAYSLLFAELLILYKYFENRTKLIWCLPALAALWSNIHGGSSPLAYFLPLGAFFISIFKFNRSTIYSDEMKYEDQLKLLCTSILSVAGIFANPIGKNVFLYPYQNLSDSVSQSVIAEWQPPDILSFSTLIFGFVPIAATVLLMIFGKKKIRFLDLCFLGFFSVLFFRSMRFMMLLDVTLAFYMIPYFPESEFIESEKLWKQIGSFALILTVIGIVGWETVTGVQQSIYVAKNDCCVNETLEVSDELKELLIETNPQRLYNDYNVGDTVIKLGIKTFFDSRADLFGEDDILNIGFSLEDMCWKAEPTGKTKDWQESLSDDIYTIDMDTLTDTYVDVEEIVDEYEFDYILIMTDRALNGYLANTERYEQLYADDVLSYYRVNETNAVEGE